MPYKDKEQQTGYLKQHYKRNKAVYLESSRRARSKMRDMVRDAKNTPCVDCGVPYPYYIMDLDHREGEEKIGPVSELVNNASRETVVAEIAKCDVVCANCHRARSWKRQNPF